MKYILKKDGVPVEDCIGKTVQSIEYGRTKSKYGDEPLIYLLFTDGTWTGIVMPSNDWGCVPKATVKVKRK